MVTELQCVGMVKVTCYHGNFVMFYNQLVS